MWRRKTKRCEILTLMRTIIGERKPNDRYDVKSRDWHATYAQMIYGYQSSPMELVGVHPTRLLTKTKSSFEKDYNSNIQAKF